MRSRTPSRLSILLFVLVLVVAFAAACGSDDNGGDDAATDTTEAVDDSNGETDTTDGDDEGNGGGGSDGDGDAFCAGFRSALESFSGTDENAFAGYVDALEALEPPAAIADAWSVIIDGLSGEQPTTDAGEGVLDAQAEIEAWSRDNCGFDPNEVTGTE